MPTKEELAKQENDSNMQFIVLLQLIIEKIEFLEEQKYLFGSVKSFLVNGKRRFEEHIGNIFRRKSSLGDLDEIEAVTAANKLLVMKERVEIALANEYLITVDERRERAKTVLSKYLISPMVDKVLTEMESENLFNF